MTRNLLAGAAALALMTGVAFAADTESTTTTRSMTTPAVPAAGNYQSSETHRGSDHDGYMARMKRFVHRNANGSTVSTKTRTTMPDGSRTTVREKEATPLSGSSIEKKTTTTIDR
jgi:hypothetical protein